MMPAQNHVNYEDQPGADRATAQLAPLRSVVPASNLHLESLLEGQIVAIRNLFTAALCRQYVAFLSTLPLVTTPAKPKSGDAVPVNDRIQVDDPAFAHQLWTQTGLQFLVQDNTEEPQLSYERRKELWGGEILDLNPKNQNLSISRGPVLRPTL